MFHLVRQEGLLALIPTQTPVGVTLAFSTRLGGVSSLGLNLAGHIGDHQEAVAENRRRFSRILGISSDWATVNQVHGARVVQVEGSETGGEADGLITQTTRPLAIFTADCIPILLWDPVRGAVGALHAGWRGTVADIGGGGVEAMARAYGSRAQDLQAWIGPGIGPCCYQVGPEVIQKVHQAYPSSPGLIQGRHLNLWEANRVALARRGLRQISVSGICTHCHHRLFYSYRASSQTGRMAAVIALQGRR